MSESTTNNPFDIFMKWKSTWNATNPAEPDAMILSTSDKSGRVSSRVVLLKRSDENGFTFFTNYQSRKAVALSENSKASLLFYWQDLKKQIRIEGVVNKIDPSLSDNYFSSRDRKSRIGAWASEQSKELLSRDELLKKVDRFSGLYPGEKIPRPPWWGGYLLSPDYFEFWEDGEHRLHTRTAFTKKGEVWVRKLLNP